MDVSWDSDGDRRYPPIGDYALLADCHSAALVSRSLSIDWACLRRFDHASAFGRLLDWERGGHFSLTPVDGLASERRYVDTSLVLDTVVTTRTGEAVVRDAFAMREGGGRNPRHQLLRIVEGIEGEVVLGVRIAPRFDYGSLRPWLRHDDRRGIYTAVGGDNALVISTDADMRIDHEQLAMVGQVRVTAGQRFRFSVVAHEPHAMYLHPCLPAEADSRMEETLTWWRRWSARTLAGGPYAQAVRQSAAVLKGLTCAPTGAIIAAPTTSLPEELGGERNWDYRYCWVRDATLTLSALVIAGHPGNALAFRQFIMRSAAGSARDLQIMYGMYGERYLPEVELDLDGYRGSRPVRIGNGAARQVQHDVYGHILDASQLWRRAQSEIDESEWQFLRQLVEAAIEVRDEPDHGIWEMRGQPRHFVHSKVTIWMAVQRGITICEDTPIEEPCLDRWRRFRDDLRAEVETRGVHPQKGYFLQAYGSDAVDASLLLLPLVGFVDANDARMKATVDRIQERLGLGPRGFIRRYLTDEGADDGLRGHEGVFLICSFWLVDVLVLQGRLDEARALYERLLGVSNDLGLFAEEYDPVGDQLLGNYPQAFTHLALIESAYRLARAESGGYAWPQPGWDETQLPERPMLSAD